jgi:hypothetical protein
MIDATFDTRCVHFIPLAYLRTLAAAKDTPEEVAYIGEDGAQAIRGAFSCVCADTRMGVFLHKASYEWSSLTVFPPSQRWRSSLVVD